MSDVSNSNWQKYFGWVKNVHAANSSYASAIVRNMLSFSNWLLEFLFETTYILLKCALYYANVSNWLKGHKNFTVIALIFMHLSWHVEESHVSYEVFNLGVQKLALFWRKNISRKSQYFLNWLSVETKYLQIQSGQNCHL